MTMLLPSYEQCRAALEAHQQRAHAKACERRARLNRPWHPSEMDVETLARELREFDECYTSSLDQHQRLLRGL